MLMWIRDKIGQMYRSQIDNPHNYTPEWWRQLLGFVGMVFTIYLLAFDIIPGFFIKHDIHKLPDGLLCLYLLIFLFSGTWSLYKPSEIIANILLGVMVILLIGGTVLEITINDMSFRQMLPFFLMILMHVILIGAVIWEWISKLRNPAQESPQDASGER
ncbi:MAG: hypothetical protein ACYC27_02815 [Armatimonadota bacterium]